MAGADGIGLNFYLAKGVQAVDQQPRGQQDHHQPVVDGPANETILIIATSAPLSVRRRLLQSVEAGGQLHDSRDDYPLTRRQRLQPRDFSSGVGWMRCKPCRRGGG